MAMIHIIGAGISGLAAATKLAEAHLPVRVYEATAHAGGRARSSNHAELGTIDHGLHFIAGDAPELTAYLTRINALDTLVPVNHPLRFARASIADYTELLDGLFRRGTLHEALSHDNILRSSWASRAARLLLHTPFEQLSARAARRALRSQRPRAMMVKHSLTQSFIAPALTHLDYCGGSIYFNHALKTLSSKTLGFAKQKIALTPEDVVILALPVAQTKSLVPGLRTNSEAHSAITLHYDVEHTEGEHIATPESAPVDLIRYQPGRISTTIRVANQVWHSDPEFLAQRIWNYLTRMHPTLGNEIPPYAVWREKVAGHLLTPDRVIDIPKLPERLLLAGDWCEADCTASLETAAASGHRAAEAAMALINGPIYRHQ